MSMLNSVTIPNPKTESNSESYTNSPDYYRLNAQADTTSSLQLNNVYPLTTGRGMTVAVIDTGIDPMFDSHIFKNTQESLDGRDDDNNGYIDKRNNYFR